MTLPMLRILPHPWDFKMMSSNHRGMEGDETGRSDKYEPLRKLAMVPQPQRNPNKPLTSFRINDILNENEATAAAVSQSKHLGHEKINGHSGFRAHHRESLSKHNHLQKTHNHAHNVNNNNRSYNQVRAHHTHPSHHTHNRMAPQQPTRIVRPWDASPTPGRNSEASSEADDEEINVDEDDDDDEPLSASALKDVSPLDALMEMANKTFQGLETSEAADAKRREQAALFGKHSTPKRRRKSRTAFTNQQIYELEKRFLYQKYLTPADRDEIAQHLGLTNAQVITWFQNRRAKLKRDLEELKNDVVATKQLSISGSSDHEFGLDSESDCESRSAQTPSKRFRSESKSPNPIDGLDSSNMSQLPVSTPERCESPGEIIVDDKEDISEVKQT